MNKQNVLNFKNDFIEGFFELLIFLIIYILINIVSLSLKLLFCWLAMASKLYRTKMFENLNSSNDRLVKQLVSFVLAR